MDVHGAGVADVFIAPDVAQQRFARLQLARVAHEIDEEIEFAALQLQRRRAAQRPMRSNVHQQVAGRQLQWRLADRGAHVRAAQLRFDPRQQLVHAERLGQIVVGADLQSDHLVDFLVTRGQHQDRHMRHRRIQRVRPHRAAQLQPVQARQHQVQYHQLRRVAANHLERLDAVGR